MSKHQLLKWSGMAAIVAGGFLIASWWLHPPDESPASILNSNWVLAHGLGMSAMLLSLLGLLGIYLKQVEKIGMLGLLGFIASFIGTANLAVIYALATMVEPVLATEAPSLLEPTSPLYTGLFGLFFLKTLVLFILGYLILGVLTYKVKILPQWGGALLAIGAAPFVLFLTGGEYPFMVFQLAGTLLGLGFAWLGYTLWSVKTR